MRCRWLFVGALISAVEVECKAPVTVWMVSTDPIHQPLEKAGLDGYVSEIVAGP
jgi:hypothetical protein